MNRRVAENVVEKADSGSPKIVEMFIYGVFAVLIIIALFAGFYSLAFMMFMGALAIFLVSKPLDETKPVAPVDVITKLLLLDDDGEVLKEWHISERTSLLIGRSYKNSQVDIDLSDQLYAVLVSQEHAVLNLADENWYIEDVSKHNGVGVRRRTSTEIVKIRSDRPYKLVFGDVIFIGKIKILVN